MLKAQPSEEKNSLLCQCLLEKTQSQVRLGQVDSLLNAGAEPNEECLTSKRYRNIISDGLVNAWRSLKDAFTGENSPRERTYSTSYQYFYPAYLARQDTALLFRLVRGGADPLLSSRNAPSVMAFFVAEDRLDVLKKLVALGANPAEMKVVYSQKKETIDFLIAQGVSKEKLSLEAILKSQELVPIVEAYALSFETLSCQPDLLRHLKREPIDNIRFLLDHGLPAACLDAKVVTEIFRKTLPERRDLSYKPERYAREEAETLSLIQTFTKHGIQMSDCGNTNHSPMILAAASGSLKAVRALVEAGVQADRACQFNFAAPYETPLDRAWMEKENERDPEALGRLEAVIAYLEKIVFQGGAQLPEPEALIQRSVLLPYVQQYTFDFSVVDTGKEAVRKALRHKTAAEILALLERGLPADALDGRILKGENESLLFAVFDNSLPTPYEQHRKSEQVSQKQEDLLALIRVLQAEEINFNQGGFGEDSLLGLVAVKANLPLVKALVAAGADPNWRYDTYDNTALEEVRKAKSRAERFNREAAPFVPIIDYLESVSRSTDE